MNKGFWLVDEFVMPIGEQALHAYESQMKPDPKTQTEMEAAAFRRLVEHLRQREDVQNLDLMNLAGFCRNCLSNWYEDAAKARGLDVSKDEARQHIYGMPYDEWKAKHQSGPTQTIKSNNH
jgi:uncharacterized protein